MSSKVFFPYVCWVFCLVLLTYVQLSHLKPNEKSCCSCKCKIIDQRRRKKKISKETENVHSGVCVCVLAVRFRRSKETATTIIQNSGTYKHSNCLDLSIILLVPLLLCIVEFTRLCVSGISCYVFNSTFENWSFSIPRQCNRSNKIYSQPK